MAAHDDRLTADAGAKHHRGDARSDVGEVTRMIQPTMANAEEAGKAVVVRWMKDMGAEERFTPTGGVTAPLPRLCHLVAANRLTG